MTRDRLAPVVSQTLTCPLRSHLFHGKIQHFVRSLSPQCILYAPATKSAHGASQSAAPATKSWRFPKCSACQEICTWRYIQSAAPATKSAHGVSQSAAPATKYAHGGSHSAVPARKSAHGGHKVFAPVTKSAHGGSGAAPATKSALQERDENSNLNGRTIPSMIRA